MFYLPSPFGREAGGEGRSQSQQTPQGYNAHPTLAIVSLSGLCEMAANELNRHSHEGRNLNPSLSIFPPVRERRVGSFHSAFQIRQAVGAHGHAPLHCINNQPREAVHGEQPPDPAHGEPVEPPTGAPSTSPGRAKTLSISSNRVEPPAHRTRNPAKLDGPRPPTPNEPYPSRLKGGGPLRGPAYSSSRATTM